MSLLTTDGNAAFLPDQIGDLVVRPVEQASVAIQVASLVRTASTTFRIPVVGTDPVASWTAEGDEITPTDAVLDEVTVTPNKLAALSIISRELAEDSSPAAAEVVGQGMARDLALKLDAAFFGTGSAPQPDGLEGVAGVTPVDAGAAYADIDPFNEAISEAEQLGAMLTAFVTDPATALTLANLKEATDSNAPLFAPDGDPTQPSRRRIAGVPLFVSPGVTAGTVWGIPRDRTFVVMREDVTLAVDRSAYFSSDRIGVRSTMRVAFGFAHEAAIVKITLSA